MRWTMGRVKEKETTFEIEQSIIFGSLDGQESLQWLAGFYHGF